MIIKKSSTGFLFQNNPHNDFTNNRHFTKSDIRILLTSQIKTDISGYGSNMHDNSSL